MNLIDLIKEASVDDAVNFHDTLNPALWENNQLKLDVRVALLKIAKNFFEFIKMTGLNTLDQEEISLYLQNKCVLIAVMQNGDAWMLGRDFGSTGIDSKFESGTALGDYMGTTLTVKGRAKSAAKKVDPTILAGLLSA